VLQYYLPSIKDANKSHPPHFELEYVTYSVADLHPREGLEDDFQYPIPLKHLPAPLWNATTSKSKYAPYGMGDLTIGSWIKLARRLGGSSHPKLRKRFRKYMFGGGKEEE
jgi:endopolyphosphatase